MHPVPQGLTVHAAGFGRRFAVHAIEHQRKRKYPTRRGTILLFARRLAKLRSRQIKSGDRYRRSHRCRSSQRPASSQSFTDLGIPNESQFRAVGINQALLGFLALGTQVCDVAIELKARANFFSNSAAFALESKTRRARRGAGETESLRPH